MSGDYPKPTRWESHRFEAYIGGTDPAVLRAAAHETARALVDRGHEPGADALVDRMVSFTDEHGVDAVAELWAYASPDSLPGALWRLYLVRAFIRQQPAAAANAYARGVANLPTADPVIAGAADPAGPEEVVALADLILRGAFSGDLGDALDRAAACARILAAGTLDDADASDVADPERASALTTRAARFASIAAELTQAARVERAGRLD